MADYPRRTLTRAGLRAVALVVLCTGTQLPGPLLACGYEDPASVALGSLNFTYPNALYVGTAVWQARQNGLLPPQANPPATGPEAAMRAGQDARLQAMRTLYQLRRHLTGAPELPTLAIVFTPAVMWSRLSPQGERLGLQMHVSGPEPDDVVMVTEPAALQAWISRSLTVAQLIEHGLIRLYGGEEPVARVRAALDRAEARRNAA
ncbi:hypothetical protein [Pseudomonas sp. N040]|uniref:hypothetical protein n=1 Tax=Pseudomonas sp. N040 TaxID=2785325 RepID=UPI0018A2ABDF|nr:hypothetical protein [Pseudomonas sp. N040]MBF7729095.1 hypothetical protein [Pseudomonas sp. N040]MBW7012735.1 hypothetical protein [Pseudomonas sp. N040]